MQQEKMYEALVTGRIHKYDYHLQNEIEIENLLTTSNSPLRKYYGSVKSFLHKNLIETTPETDVYFMCRIEAVYTEEPQEKLEIKMLDVNYMGWKLKDEE